MFPLFRKNLSFLPSLSSPQVRTLPIRLVREFSLSSSSSHPQPHCKQFEQENVRVVVWWNFNNCGVPSGFSVRKIARSIMGAVRANGIKGPIDIRAYGDVSQFSKFQRIALFLARIRLCPVTPGGASEAICSVATILWSWSSILKGEDLNGKYFNYPPDGPFGSWYGGSKVPLENTSATEDVTP